MQYPRLNPNDTDTDAATLLREYREAVEAVMEAMRKLAVITVNGRGYQTLNSNAAAIAFDEHRRRLERLDIVKTELGAILENLLVQIKERR